jgi:hypothetical protein
MNRFAKGFCGILCSAALLMSSAIVSISASALDNGIYLADATSYYAHPYTGVIEDSGGESSAVLGQSMTESALCPQALIEVDPDGNMYATIRLSLMDNIEEPQFMVQADGYSEFYDVQADCMQENLDNNTSDFRFPIDSENSIVRSTFYVVPMGRDVIFYIGFSNLAEGSGDFVTSVEVLPLTEEETVTEAPTEVTELKTTASTATETTATTETVTTSAVETTTVQTTKSTETITEKSDVKGIVMFDENGNEIKEFSNKAATENTEDKKSNVGIAVGVTAGVIVVIGAVLMIFYKRKKGGK